jgi:hypothetical protein
MGIRHKISQINANADINEGVIMSPQNFYTFNIDQMAFRKKSKSPPLKKIKVKKIKLRQKT